MAANYFQLGNSSARGLTAVKKDKFYVFSKISIMSYNFEFFSTSPDTAAYCSLTFFFLSVSVG